MVIISGTVRGYIEIVICYRLYNLELMLYVNVASFWQLGCVKGTVARQLVVKNHSAVTVNNTADTSKYAHCIHTWMGSLSPCR